MSLAVNFKHLAPWAHEIAMLPNQERIQKIRTDRWIGYTKTPFSTLN